jgi:NAD-dependent dihydropyrimidine dehydrogenase PreA subunit
MTDAMSTECPGVPGKVMPAIDRNRCEAKAGCVAVCPYEVFEIRLLGASDRDALSWRGRLKAWVHGGRQAYVVRAADCHACRRCLDACPEGAIRLVPFTAG